jgi:hypothetical protein
LDVQPSKGEMKGWLLKLAKRPEIGFAEIRAKVSAGPARLVWLAPFNTSK